MSIKYNFNIESKKNYNSYKINKKVELISKSIYNS